LFGQKSPKKTKGSRDRKSGNNCHKNRKTSKKNVPNSVTIITKEEIEATSARYVDDLLRNMVGVNHNS